MSNPRLKPDYEKSSMQAQLCTAESCCQLRTATGRGAEVVTPGEKLARVTFLRLTISGW